MYDNFSTDGSPSIGRKLGFDVRTFGFQGSLDDQQYINIKNECWKEQRGKGVDFVIVCDCDEFVVLDELEYAVDTLCSAPVVKGFNMISNNLPSKSIFEINKGAESESYSKQAIFNPDKIQEIAFVHGCHKNNMIGDISTFQTCRLFHFRQIGGINRQLNKHTAYRRRLSKFNLRHNMGHHYGRPEWTPAQIQSYEDSKRKEWIELQQQSRQLW